jgi:hypothetical protein
VKEAALVIASYRREDIDGCFANRCERSDEAFEIIIGAPAQRAFTPA